MELSNSYRFWLNGSLTAVLGKDGKLTLKDGTGSIEIWENWRYYLRDVVHTNPTKGDEVEILKQLGGSLGQHQEISEIVHRGTVGKEVAMAPSSAAKTAPEKKAAKKAAPKSNGKGEAEVLNECICGCGGKTKKNFVPGHDSKVHSWQRKVAKGELKIGTLPASAQKYIRAHQTA